MSPDEGVLKSIINEYQDLAQYNPGIEKQFISSDGRKYNAYLLSTSSTQYPKIVAKGLVNESIDLNKERVITQLLLNNNVNVPKLIYVNVIPSRYLLLEYIEGEKLEDVLSKNKSLSSEIFNKLGTLIGEMHTVNVDRFGEIFASKDSSWFEYVEEKFIERLSYSEKQGYTEIVKYSEDLWASTQDLVKKEGLEKPVVNHRDLYLDNFILTPKGQLYVLDFGLLRGGRPFFDLGKLYLFVLKKYPQYHSSFLKGYKNYIELDTNSRALLKFYIVLEILGMIPFFHSMGNKKVLNEVLSDFAELIAQRGIVNNLIDDLI